MKISNGVKKEIGMCLDTAHAFESNVDPSDFIKHFGQKIKEVHLIDGIYSDPVTHYPLGAGEVDLISVFDKLEKINYQGIIILEVNSQKDLLESKKYLKTNGYL